MSDPNAAILRQVEEALGEALRLPDVLSAYWVAVVSNRTADQTRSNVEKNEITAKITAAAEALKELLAS